jgi:oligopeptide/dipeptide ABC transporter ATP-binding protein
VVLENADRVGVMYAGKIVEQAPVQAIFERPEHPYTRGLLRSMPGAQGSVDGRRLPTLPGGVPDASNPPPGCRFHPRCPDRFAPCDREEPVDVPTGPERAVACFLHDERYAAGMPPRSPGS